MKILVVDDHELVREAVKLLLNKLRENLVVLEAANCKEALALAAQHADLSLILLDNHMPGKSGLESLSEFRQAHPGVPIVVLSASEDRQDVLRALDGGAMGFIPKSHPTAVMLDALRVILAGGVYLPAKILGQSVDHSEMSASAATRQTPESVSSAEIGLTERQTEVLTLLIQGKPNKLICHELGLAESTVKVHVTAILRALGVTNRTQAVIAVSRLGLKFGLTPKRAS
jgi:DNA-binding NarL/FixJ family response regulator